MSIHCDQRQPTWSLETAKALEMDKDHGTTFAKGLCLHITDLHRDILNAAENVKQVEKDVNQLKQENAFLRKELLLSINGKQVLRSSAGVIAASIEEFAEAPVAPAVEAEASGRPSVPTEPPVVLPFCPDWTEAPSNESETQTQEQGPGKRRVLATQQKRASASHLGGLSRGLYEDPAQETNSEPDKQLGKIRTSVFTTRTSIFARDDALRGMLFDPQSIKNKMKQSLVKQDFDVSRYYLKDGCAQIIARSHIFEHISLIVILLNTIWIAVDTEHNDADVLVDADLCFQIPEHCFCFYFLSELLVRFAAFECKRDCLRSGWFIFDGLLVAAMVFEDWIMTLVLLASAGGGSGGTGIGVLKDAAIVRILRVLRLARLTRAVKLIRQSPEVMIMAKALAASTRCVIWTCVLLTCMIFFFGICFTQMCKDSPLQEEYFPSLTGSLHTLLIAGLFPDLEHVSKTINKAHFLYWAVFMLYLMFTTITILNLLVGVLVEVAQTSARIERDAMDVAYVKEVFVGILNLQDVEDFRDVYVSKEEFGILLQETVLLKALTKVGIDVFGLIDLMDFIFLRGALCLVELLEVVLQLRSSADATVRDLVEVRKFLTFEMHKLKAELVTLSNGMLDTQKKTSQMIEWTREKNGMEKAPFLN